MEKVILIGAGGHARVVADVLLKNNNFEIYGYVDKLDKGKLLNKINYLGDDDVLLNLYKKNITNIFCGIGSIGDVSLRKQIIEKCIDIGFNFINVIHPTAVIGNDVYLGRGIYIAAGVIINSSAKIYDYAILNTGSIIEHECIIEEYVHIAPGAILGGKVIVRKNSHIGLGARVIQGIKIGSNSIIGAGSVVINDVENDKKVVGVPAKIIN